MEKTLLFIYNPKAGKGKIKSHLSDIVDIFTRHFYRVRLHPTQFPRDAYEQTKALQGRVDLIVVSGGDGTLDEVVTALMETGSNTPIGYIPSGSTNDFANSLFIPKDMIEAAVNIMQEVLYNCDIGRFNQQTFAYVAAFGIFTDVSYATDQGMKNIFGYGAYILEGIKRLFDIKSYRLKVECEELSTEGDFIYGMVTNSRSVGGFKNLTGKNVDMNDGLFEVTLIRMPKDFIELQELIGAMATQEDNSDLIYTFKSRKLLITSSEPVPWTLDGEFGGSHTRVEIENRHKALHLYLKSTKALEEKLQEQESYFFPM